MKVKPFLLYLPSSSSTDGVFWVWDFGLCFLIFLFKLLFKQCVLTSVLNPLFDVTNYLSSPNDKQYLEPLSPSYCWVMYASTNFRVREALFSVLPTKFRGRIYPDSFILLWYNTMTKVACKRKHLIWF